MGQWVWPTRPQLPGSWSDGTTLGVTRLFRKVTARSVRPQGKIIRNDQGHSHRICMATNYEPEWELKEVESPVRPAGKLFPGKEEVEYGQLETSLCVQAVFHAVAVICHLFTSPLTSGHASLRCRSLSGVAGSFHTSLASGPDYLGPVCLQRTSPPFPAPNFAN